MKCCYNPCVVLLISAVAAYTISGCDTADLKSPPTTEKAKYIVESSVQSMSILPVVGKSKSEEFVLRIEMDNSNPRLRLPAGIHVMTRRKHSRPVVIYDDGKRVDAHAGDGVYTGIIPYDCVPRLRRQQIALGKDIEFMCTFDFVGPGEKCGSFGECPERVRRSLLWGLIEYETDILFCVCVVECEVTKK